MAEDEIWSSTKSPCPFYIQVFCPPIIQCAPEKKTKKRNTHSHKRIHFIYNWVDTWNLFIMILLWGFHSFTNHLACRILMICKSYRKDLQIILFYFFQFESLSVPISIYFIKLTNNRLKILTTDIFPQPIMKSQHQNVATKNPNPYFPKK